MVHLHDGILCNRKKEGAPTCCDSIDDLFSHLCHVSLSQCACYVLRVRALVFVELGHPTMLCCSAICGGGVQKGTMLLARLLAGFQSLFFLPTNKLGPSGSDSWVGGFL